MSIIEIKTDSVYDFNGALSQGILASGRMLFISGMTAERADGSIAGIGDVAGQTRQVCENIKAIVEAAGGTLADICRLDVYVRDMEHIGLIREVRHRYFMPPRPASTMLEVSRMVSPDHLVEISAIAMLPA